MIYFPPLLSWLKRESTIALKIMFSVERGRFPHFPSGSAVAAKSLQSWARPLRPHRRKPTRHLCPGIL